MSDDRVIDDWVDVEEIRLLAAKLIAPSKLSPGLGDDPAYGPEFEGFADPGSPLPVVAPPPSEPVSLPEKESPSALEAEDRSQPGVVQPNPFSKKKSAAVAGAADRVVTPFRPGPPRDLPVPNPRPRREDEQVTVGGNGEALGDFVDWLKKEIPLEALMICGAGGAVLFDDLGEARLASVARMLAGAAHRKGKGAPAALVVKTGSKRVLQVVPFEHGGDHFFAALSLPRPLAEGGIRAFLKALEKVLG
jgi:hypothetical protein